MQQDGVRDRINNVIIRYVRERKRQKCINIPLEVLERYRKIQQAMGVQDWVLFTTALELLIEMLEKESTMEVKVE